VVRWLTLVVPAMGISLFNVPTLLAQSATAAAPKFEVASVKPCTADSKSGGKGSSPERLHLACMTVETIIQTAYGIFSNDSFNAFAPYIPISGSPKWIDSARYQIDAKAERPQSSGKLNGSMLRALLEDRFNLKIHRETREVPVYALVVTKGGPKLQPFKEGSCMTLDFSDPEHSPMPSPKPGQPFPVVCGMGRVTDNGYDLPGATMATFCRDISPRLDRPMIDGTGLGGTFDIHLDLSAADLGYPVPDSSDLAPPHNPDDPSRTSAAVGSAIRKLGLKLEPSKGPGEFLVIDHIERPSAN